MIETQEYTFDNELFIEPHVRLRNILVINDGPGRISAKPGDGRESHYVGITAGDGLVIFDPEGVGMTLFTDAPRTSITVTHVFSRALYSRGSTIEADTETDTRPGTGKRRSYR